MLKYSLLVIVLTVVVSQLLILAHTISKDHHKVQAIYACLDEKSYYVNGFEVALFRQCLDDYAESR